MARASWSSARTRRLPHTRAGSTGRDGSGEIMLACSTAQRLPSRVPAGKLEIAVLAEGGYNTRALNMLFDATVEATEEAVINALVAATTTTGRGGRVLHAIPHDRLRALVSRERDNDQPRH